MGLKPAETLALTPYEFSLWVKGHTRHEHYVTLRSVTAAWLNAVFSRNKRIPPLKTVLPEDPTLTKLEKQRDLWSKLENLVVMVGEKPAKKKKKRE